MKFYVLFFINLFNFPIQSQEPNFQLIISEIYADPSPSHGLPESEYIEIYNPSSQNIDLKGYFISYNSQTRRIDSGSVEAQTYVIICKQENAVLFSNNAIGISSLSLTNTGAEIRLWDATKNLVDYVNYSDKWYTSGFEQGYSLEIMDLSKPCKKEKNWTSSKNIKGGTPGFENSIIGPLIFDNPPRLESILVKNKVLELSFSTEMNIPFLLNTDLYSFSNNIELTSIESILGRTNRLLLYISRNLKFNELVELRIEEIRDCLETSTFNEIGQIGELPPSQKHEIQISEVLFNPDFEKFDYLEIHNSSNRNINLKSWYITNNQTSIQLSERELIIAPNQYLAFSENINSLADQFSPFLSNKKNYIQVAKLPSFPNSDQNISIFNADSLLIDFAYYSEKFHSELIKNKKGVALERTNFKNKATSQIDWQSASILNGYGSPGYENSAIELLPDSKIILEVTPAIFYLSQEENHCELQFDNLGSGTFMSIKILDRNGNEILDLLPFSLVNSKGKISWYGNSKSNFVSPGIYLFLIKTIRDNTMQKFLKKVVVGP